MEDAINNLYFNGNGSQKLAKPENMASHIIVEDVNKSFLYGKAMERCQQKHRHAKSCPKVKDFDSADL